jgi:hypothetical protein
VPEDDGTITTPGGPDMTAERPSTANEGLTSEAFGNEALKLKVDDLFRDVEALKRRLAQLERRAEREYAEPPQMLSDPDRR